MNVIVSKCVLGGEMASGDRRDYVQVREALYGAQALVMAPFYSR